MKVILFDGVCHFCHKSVQFIIKRDKREQFHFASLQSDVGKDLLKQYNLPEDTESFIFIDGKKAYDKSSAALHLCKHLDSGWKLFYSFIIVPKRVRDFFYTIIANNRYKLARQKETCHIPPKHVRKRFL
ncbi:MAG TPA: DCC1-like thiol-disulfide oxidoreductase family protein [Bacillota bacterium]|nr:DCC1-like thiol-disulfide oxidoreductase family protein [Bacillota bacterium]